MKPVSFYVVSDTHYFENSLGAEGKAYESYIKKEQFFMRESGPIIESVFKSIAEDKETDIVIIPGDLTKNGELESHKSFIRELYKLKESGKIIYVITAGHDYGTSFAFRDDKQIEAEGADFHALAEMYRDFGYGSAIAFDSITHSYVAQISESIRMLALCCDGPDQPKGAIDERLTAWAKEQLDKAKEDNCSVFAICHYPIIPSVPVFELVGDAKIKSWREIASFLADNGAELVFTGHMHVQSINEFFSEKGNRLIDVCTSCLPGSPAKYRKVTVNDKSVLKIKSVDIGNFDWDTNGLTPQEYCYNQFHSAIIEKIYGALQGGKGIVKVMKKAAKKIFSVITVGTLGRLLLIKVPDSLKDKKLTDFAGDIGVAIFLGDMPYVKGTETHDLISRTLKRFSFIIKKIEPKLSRDGNRIDLTDMLLNTIGSNKPYSDNEAEFTIK